ncbi:MULTISPECIES: hypothetical protein [Psychrobacter]|jgi:hypothetical protein|uniref:Uncharacterized protein n=1 Tax=Psychrobacter immobilis TaxID=498 RepID=A0A2V2AAH7_PSYIM|nr:MULTISPECIES: hypothetical protein [Psychrobacter]MDN5561842.1 hypothetical protein [Psychrobacter sp.]GAF59616.1 hypothetical protein JCM18902_2485 [Psychrobacter sp. JCM 18902]KRG34602.1 hypothetical protein AK822_06960 [Psychrobacter sp. P11F6]MCG3808016.1 hypothetical protein [Psychrobacter sp. Ps4]PWK14674.1 hypothetical protein C8D84_102149 [Psychrobacter immobilis]
MIRLSYTLKCWALGVTYFLVFYFMVVMSDPGFSKYIYMLALSTLLFPVAKRSVDVMTDFFTPNTVLFNGLLPSLLINVVIWILTPFIVALTVIAFVLYSMGVLTEKISH